MIIESHKKRPAILALLISCIFLSGCNAITSLWKSRSILTTPNGARIEQKGAVEIPAHIETNKVTTEIPLSIDSKVSIMAATENTPANVVVTSPAPTRVIQTQNLEVATAAKPVAPPTPIQIAEADGVGRFYLVAAGLAVLGLILGYAGHVKAAAFAFLGAVGIPITAHVANKIAASFVGVAAICIAGSLFAAWFLLKEHPEILADARAKLESEANQIRSRVDSLRESVEKRV